MCPNAPVDDTDEGGKHPGSIPDVSHFRTDGTDGESCVFNRLGGVVDERAAYPDSSRRSEQLSCTKFFDPSYGLPDINFKRFKSFLGFI